MSNTLAQQNIKTLDGLIKVRSKAISAVAASHMKPERLTKLVLGSVSRTPALAKCSPESVFRSLMQAAELGLEPGSATGEAYLVPFGTECTLIPGYRGLISLAFRSGQVKSVTAKCVMAGDLFEYEEGLNPILRHVPSLEVEQDKEGMTHAYCVIQLTSGGVIYDVMTKKAIDKIRARSKASSSGPWVTDYLEMAKKTVVRRTLKYAPMSVEMARALAVDDHANGVVDNDAYNIEWGGDDLDPETGEITPAASKSDKLAEKLPPAQEEVPPPVEGVQPNLLGDGPNGPRD